MPRHPRKKAGFSYCFPFPDFLKPFRALGFEDGEIYKLIEGHNTHVAKKAAEWVIATLQKDVHSQKAFLFRYGPLEEKKPDFLTSILPATFPEEITPEKTEEFIGITCKILRRIV